jgi:hypothetical protein
MLRAYRRHNRKFGVGTQKQEELMAPARGVVDSGIPDLASNPKHLKGFGRGARRNR